MKKSVVLTLFIFSLVLILLIAGLCIYFFLLRAPAQETPDSTPLSVADYAARQWPDYDVRYTDGLLTLSRQTDMTYAEARTLAADIYRDELAPETYLTVVQTIAIDVAANCDAAPEVLLRYCSTDGETVFSLSSSGEIQTCWAEKGGAE